MDAQELQEMINALHAQLTNGDSPTTIASDAKALVELMDDGVIGSDAPLVLVDRARAVRDRARALATFDELHPSNSRANAHRRARISRTLIGR